MNVFLKHRRRSTTTAESSTSATWRRLQRKAWRNIPTTASSSSTVPMPWYCKVITWEQVGLCVVDPAARRTGSRYCNAIHRSICKPNHVQHKCWSQSVHFTLHVSLILTWILKGDDYLICCCYNKEKVLIMSKQSPKTPGKYLCPNFIYGSRTLESSDIC